MKSIWKKWKNDIQEKTFLSFADDSLCNRRWNLHSCWNGWLNGKKANLLEDDIFVKIFSAHQAVKKASEGKLGWPTEIDLLSNKTLSISLINLTQSFLQESTCDTPIIVFIICK